MENIFWCVKDEEGLRPLAGMWRSGKMDDYNKSEREKFIKSNPDCEIVKVELKEIE